MPISADRIQNDVVAIASFVGALRPTFSPAWRQARDYVAAQAEAMGCRTRIDPAGNLHARPSAISWESPAWMSGSHLNTIGGAIGVIAALETLRAAREDLKVACPLELVVWAAGDDPTFGQRAIGSRAFAGELNVAQLGALKNAQGATYLDAGAPHGVTGDKLAADQLRATTVIGLIEINSEDGLAVWDQGLKFACAVSLAGKRQYRCEVTALPDAPRMNALRAVADAVLAMEKIVLDLGGDSSIAVGHIALEPNLADVPPKRATFIIGLRSPKMPALAMGDQTIKKSIDKIAQSRGVQMNLTVIANQSAVELDARVAAKLQKSAVNLRLDPLHQTFSGHSSDAFALATRLPVGRLVVPGQDISAVVAILLETVRDRRLE